MFHSLPGGYAEGPHRRLRLYFRDIRDLSGRKRPLDVKVWCSVKDVKDQLAAYTHIPVDRQRLFYKGRELKNTHSLQECGIYKDGAMVIVSTLSALVGKQNRCFVEMYAGQPCPRELLKVFHQVQRGLDLGYAPVLAMEGQGGTYFMKDSYKRYVACFKPRDEEPFADCNPRGLIGQIGNGQVGLREGILAGEACEREVAAFLLDHGRFAGVPPTGLVECYHPAFNYPAVRGMERAHREPKPGSLQEFVEHHDVMSNLSPSMFSDSELQKIALFDIRIINTDRHDANLLVVKKRDSLTGERVLRLVPIDHGYCMPDKIDVAWCDWCWFSWPQIKNPLSKRAREYVEKIDVEEDVRMLRKRLSGLRDICLRNFKIAGLLLKKGVQTGLSLFEIAQIMCRDNLDDPSALEIGIKKCEQITRDQIRKNFSFSIPKPVSKPKGQAPSTSLSRSLALDGVGEMKSLSDSTDPLLPDVNAVLNDTQVKKLVKPLNISLDVNILATSPGSGRSSFDGYDSAPASPPGFWASNPPIRDWDKTSSLLEKFALEAETSSVEGISPKSWNQEEPSMTQDTAEILMSRLNSQYDSTADCPPSRFEEREGDETAVFNGGEGAEWDIQGPRAESPAPFTSLSERANGIHHIEESSPVYERVFFKIMGRILDELVEAAAAQRATNETTKSRGRDSGSSL